MRKIIYNIALLGSVFCTSQIKGQVVLEALDAPNEKCLELVKDRHYGDGLHNFIYCAVQGPNGKKWLNLNLGAEYAKESSPHFNPEAVPVDYKDWKAGGSLFQYGRKADGHELVTYNGSNNQWVVNRVFPTIGTTVDPINSPQNYVDSPNQYWSNQHLNLPNDLSALSALWDGVNNPCPTGYRVMNKEDLLSFAKVGEFLLEPNSHVGLATMGILKNTKAPNLNLFTSVIFEWGLTDDVFTCVNGCGNGGSSGLWLSYSSNAPFTFSSTGGWSGSMNHANFVDLGYFKGGTYELATGSIHYVWPIGYNDNYVTRPYGAVRCVEN